MNGRRPKGWNPNNTNNPVIKCRKCGKEFIRKHNCQCYCEDCKKPLIKNPNGTIPKVCENCHEDYLGSSPMQKYCLTCVPIMKRKREKEYKENHKKGYSQEGKSNNNWKGGIGIYRNLADGYGLPSECNRCGSKDNLLIHHRDRDRYNNEPENLERLCKSCHQIEHEAGINLHPTSKAFRSNKV